MIELLLIGIGTGNPDHITREAIKHLQRADIILVPRKGDAKSDLANLRWQICEQALGQICEQDRAPILEFDLPVRDADAPYLDAVDAWHDAIAGIWQSVISSATQTLGKPPSSAALLIWGDPCLYDSSLRIAARLHPTPNITVIPGITAIQALTAAHRIPLNELGASVVITTGRRLLDAGFPREADTAIIMLDGQQAFTSLVLSEFDIWWGAYLGMANQMLISGPLDEVAQEIITRRAQARTDHGWIMDCYMLRVRKP